MFVQIFCHMVYLYYCIVYIIYTHSLSLSLHKYIYIYMTIEKRAFDEMCLKL